MQKRAIITIFLLIISLVAVSVFSQVKIIPSEDSDIINPIPNGPDNQDFDFSKGGVPQEEAVPDELITSITEEESGDIASPFYVNLNLQKGMGAAYNKITSCEDVTQYGPTEFDCNIYLGGDFKNKIDYNIINKDTSTFLVFEGENYLTEAVINSGEAEEMTSFINLIYGKKEKNSIIRNYTIYYPFTVTYTRKGDVAGFYDVQIATDYFDVDLIFIDENGNELTKKYTVTGGNVQYTSKGIVLSEGASVYDQDLKYSVKNKNGPLLITDSVEKAAGENNYIIANENGLLFNANNAQITLDAGNPWIEVGEGDVVTVTTVGFGRGLLQDGKLTHEKGTFRLNNCGDVTELKENPNGKVNDIIEVTRGEKCASVDMVTSKFGDTCTYDDKGNLNYCAECGESTPISESIELLRSSCTGCDMEGNDKKCKSSSSCTKVCKGTCTGCCSSGQVCCCDTKGSCKTTELETYGSSGEDTQYGSSGKDYYVLYSDSCVSSSDLTLWKTKFKNVADASCKMIKQAKKSGTYSEKELDDEIKYLKDTAASTSQFIYFYNLRLGPYSKDDCICVSSEKYDKECAHLNTATIKPRISPSWNVGEKLTIFGKGCTKQNYEYTTKTSDGESYKVNVIGLTCSGVTC